jgi:hypothetical protein
VERSPAPSDGTLAIRALVTFLLVALRDWTGARRQVLSDRRSGHPTRRRQFVDPGPVDNATRVSLAAWALIGVPMIFGAIVGLRSLLWDGGRPAESTLDHLLVVFSATWMAPVVVTAVTVVGYIPFRRPEPERSCTCSTTFPTLLARWPRRTASCGQAA